MSEAKEFRSGFIPIVGKPNVGKSSIMNAMIGEKIAIVSNRPQTTRNRIMGVITTGKSQFVFLDTPGIHDPRTRLGEYMMHSVRDAMEGIKKLKKDSVITEDDQKIAEKDLQKVTDSHIEELDKIGADKEKEIMSV